MINCVTVNREEIKKLTQDPKDIELIFSNIMDIYELTYNLTGSLEDVMEMAQEQMSYIGSCFEGDGFFSINKEANIRNVVLQNWQKPRNLTFTANMAET